MSAAARPPYDVVETFDASTYRLARRPRGLMTIGGVLSILVGSVPVAMGAAFLGMFAWTMKDASIKTVLGGMSINIVPVGFVVGGLWLVFRGLYAIAGHDEVAISPCDVRAVRKVGPLCWTRSVRRDRLRQFTIVRTAVVGGTPNPPTARGFNLRAELDGGRSKDLLIDYPRDVVRDLASDLAVRCKTMPLDAADFVETPPKVVVREESDVGTEVRERLVQPPESTAIVDRSGGDLRITLPAVGFWRGSSPFAKFFVAFWCTGTSFLVTSFTIAIWTGAKIEREGAFPESNWFLILFFAPFVLIGVGGALMLINAGRRRAELTVTGQVLAIERNEWFRNQACSWNREDLRYVFVHVEEHRDSESGTKSWTHSLRIMPTHGSPVSLLAYRPKTELEWIATTIRATLGLPAS